MSKLKSAGMKKFAEDNEPKDDVEVNEYDIIIKDDKEWWNQGYIYGGVKPRTH